MQLYRYFGLASFGSRMYLPACATESMIATDWGGSCDYSCRHGILWIVSQMVRIFCCACIRTAAAAHQSAILCEELGLNTSAQRCVQFAWTTTTGQLASSNCSFSMCKCSHPTFCYLVIVAVCCCCSPYIRGVDDGCEPTPEEVAAAIDSNVANKH